MTQFGLAQIVRPDLNALKNQYQGKSSAIPIAWPGVKDPAAWPDGVPPQDYYPTLLAGTPVPFGSRVVVWLPVFLRWTSAQKSIAQVAPYAWQFVWRLRNGQSYAQFSTKGVPSAGYRFPSPDKHAGFYTIPAAVGGGITVAAPATPSFDPVNVGQLGQRSRPIENWVQPSAAVLGDMTGIGSTNLLPLLADGRNGYIEQETPALNNPPQGNLNLALSWNPVVVDALGDELILLQTPPTTGTWDFTSPYSDKLLFDALEENPDVGVYVISGTGVAGTVQNPQAT
jgi:hypothetical protein